MLIKLIIEWIAEQTNGAISVDSIWITLAAGALLLFDRKVMRRLDEWWIRKRRRRKWKRYIKKNPVIVWEADDPRYQEDCRRRAQQGEAKWRSTYNPYAYGNYFWKNL